jgi:hypothetical protein
MDLTNLVYLLAFASLGAALAFGVWQYFRARQAKRNHEHAALANHPGGAMSDHDRELQRRNN